MKDKTVCLVLPRFKYPSGDIFLGLAYLSSYLKKNLPNINVKLIDATFNPSMDYINKKLDEYDPHIVGIYMGTLMFSDGLKVAKVSKNKGIHVLIGGPHPTILPDSVISNKNVNAIVMGEGEITFYEYIKEFFGEKQFEKVDGIWFKKNEMIIKNKPRTPIENLDSIPYPDFNIYDVEKYIRNWIPLESVDPKLRGLPVIASRGCPFNCSYCQPTLDKLFGKKLRIRTPKNVVDELEFLKRKYDINCFYFMDDTFTALKPWVIEFSNILINRNIGMKWVCNTRADTYDKEMLKIMKKSGLVKVKVGIESICENIRNKVLNKNISYKQITALIEECNNLDIQVAGFFMIGTPTETKKDIWKTIKFAIKSKLMEASFTITTPLPKTYLYETALKNNWGIPKKYEDYDYYKVTNKKNKNRLSTPYLKMSMKMAYILFYLHPKRIVNTLRMSASLDGFKRTLLKLKRL